jgi:hypothetical protein
LFDPLVNPSDRGNAADCGVNAFVARRQGDQYLVTLADPSVRGPTEDA